MEENLKFVMRYSDDERHPVTIDNDDWDEILQSLAILERMMSEWADVKDMSKAVSWMNLMRVLFESLYLAGYNRGKNVGAGE